MDNILASPHTTVIIVGIIFLIAKLLFGWTLFSLLKRIPKEHQTFPAWFVWLFWIPYAGYVFEWLMLPFGVPNAIKKGFSSNQNAVQTGDTLFKIGLAQVIVALFHLLFWMPEILSWIIFFCVLGLWAWYWITAIVFLKKYK
ncbi:MAG: hypothetical protein ACD_70C00131G0004 [uncultured bacterium]|nr:MAG: hypothetical protein ACD_70C00131G0004 [uncultured bacterium]OGT25877.1 MAG: hypothetical protein A3B71_07465 [Gammaproteobacteria bacterium RIFCSPHIGHO2_02_FULL_42_43]OGT52261.1 MAG: hypothetical protein A3E54_01340 [Gammaproteobacteria bacterium RIFCSPHIGHO2_12_FULL_41_25]OGT61874.1 MAG: hypothetical protein A3I77_01280 [Gammaproteobacteria bacterium RIFCSPLOWO2_02_FULL_42_14]OGT86416.1 MAG: hypothetical protein A3G86_07815 [Gammaproteobacteria bacterium RIFCSPLOWO2_12_FULL_42_18]